MAETIDELKKLLEAEKRKVAALEQKLSLYQKDATIRGYYVQNKVVNQQIDLLDNFNLDKEIKLNPKEDKFYDRAMSLSDNLPKTIAALNQLKIELKITGNEDRDKKNVPLAERFAETRN